MKEEKGIDRIIEFINWRMNYSMRLYEKLSQSQIYDLAIGFMGVTRYAFIYHVINLEQFNYLLNKIEAFKMYSLTVAFSVPLLEQLKREGL